MARCLNDGVLEIDYNLVENTIRPVAIGRKNYLFADSHEAAQRTAMRYTDELYPGYFAQLIR